MSLLQHFLTGAGGDPRQMAKGIAAQHGRAEHNAEFSEKHSEALISFYESLADTGFEPEVEATPIGVRANPKDYPLESLSLEAYASTCKRSGGATRPGSDARISAPARCFSSHDDLTGCLARCRAAPGLARR